MNPLWLILGKVLAKDVDLKAMGTAQAKKLLSTEMQKKLDRNTKKVATKMEEEGRNWKMNIAGAGGAAKGIGFVLSRDALFRLIRALGIPGVVADGWRDSADDAVWDDINGSVTPNMTSLEELVKLTAKGLVDHTF
jgi:hypothetical protein